MSCVRLKDRTDDSSVLQNNIENASVLDSPRNGESHNVEISDSISSHVCTRNVLVKENLVDTDVISSNNSSLADSVKTISEQEGLSNGLDDVEPASLDLEDPMSTPDILQQLDDDFYNYEQFKDTNEWNDAVCDKETDITATILQADYFNDNKPNSVDAERGDEVGDEVRQTYTSYGEDDIRVNDVNNDKSAFILHPGDRTISNFVTPEKLNVHGTDVFGQLDCEFSIQSKYIEMYDVISSETSNEKSRDLQDSFSFDFTFDDADIKVESNVHIPVPSEDSYLQKSSMRNDANTSPNNLCDVGGVKNTVQSKDSERVAVETKNQIQIQGIDTNDTTEEQEADNEGRCEQHVLENGLDAHNDPDNSDFTEFMEHGNLDGVPELTSIYAPISSNYETVQIHDLHALSSDTTPVKKFSSIKEASLPCINTSLDCLKDNINLTSTVSEECATYKSENSVVYFSDGEFYDFDLRDIEPVEDRLLQENSYSAQFYAATQEENDDFGDFTNFSSTTAGWKASMDVEEPKMSEDDDDFGDFSNFESSMGVVETQQFSLKESISRIENKNVSLGAFVLQDR